MLSFYARNKLLKVKEDYKARLRRKGRPKGVFFVLGWGSWWCWTLVVLGGGPGFLMGSSVVVLGGSWSGMYLLWVLGVFVVVVLALGSWLWFLVRRVLALGSWWGIRLWFLVALGLGGTCSGFLVVLGSWGLWCGGTFSWFLVGPLMWGAKRAALPPGRGQWLVYIRYTS